jgi:hemerythrin
VAESVQVQPRFSPHPVETNIFYFRYQEGGEAKIFGHLADIVSSAVLGRMKNPEAKYHISEDFFDKTLQSYLERSNVKRLMLGEG